MDSMEDYFMSYIEGTDVAELYKANEKILEAGSSSIVLYLEGDPVIEISTDGFYVRGKKVTDDVQLYKAFKKFLTDTGCYLE